MDSNSTHLSNNFQCACKSKLFGCYYSAHECLGVYCKKCWKEWLLPEFADEVIDPVDVDVVEHGGITYYSTTSSLQRGPCESPVLQVTSSREEIIPKYVAESVKPGDHIMWRRPWVVWHHAIVEDVNGCNVTLIHFGKEEKQVVIHRKTVDATQEYGQMYLVVYDKAVRKSNPSELVLARARALIGTTGYQLLSRNCENFATFCKTGVSANHQRGWFINKLEDIGKCIWNTAAAKIISPLIKVGAAEILELGLEGMNVVSASAELVGVGVIIAFEAGICIWNLGKLYEHYQSVPSDGKQSLSRKEFISEAIALISEHLFGATCGAGLGVGLTALGTLICPGLGIVAGAVLGIIGGSFGCALGHAVGLTVGRFLARAITSTFKANDRSVRLEDIKPGDHIVLFGNVLHPRCHAIAMSINEDTNEIVVIRHTFKHGVTYEAVPFVAPVYRVFYPPSISTYTSEEIMVRATNALAEYTATYNILLNNCKDFVYSITVKT